MTRRGNFYAFWKAVFVGTLAGSCGPTIATTLMGLMILGDSGSFLENVGKAAYLVVLPTLLSFCIVLPCSICVGLPASFLLRRFSKEQREVYTWIGAVAGMVAPILLVLLISGEQSLLMILLGTFSGAVTGWIWGTERERILQPAEGYSPLI